MLPKRRLHLLLLILLLLALLLGAVGFLTVRLVLVPALPSTEVLKDMRFQVPLRVYSRDMRLIAEYGEQKRSPLAYEQIPELMIKAVLAAEDDGFFEHSGVDYKGLLRAVVYLLRTGEKGQGGSTITMQVARNFFLSSEKTYLRKLNEVLLAFKIEEELSKQEIIELYLNKIFLGQRAYGVGAAAQVYYGKNIDQLHVAQLAMIAGLPKAPSAYNPVVNPSRALARRNYVLGRMRGLNYIDEATYQDAVAQPVTATVHALAEEVPAPYVGELARAYALALLGDDVYTGGYVVVTAIDSRMQQAAAEAHRRALLDYDTRLGYRGPERRLTLADDDSVEQWDRHLREFRAVNDLWPALVLEVKEREARVYLPQQGIVTLDWEMLSQWRPQGAELKSAGQLVRRGDVIRVYDGTVDGDWRLAQIPEVEGALVSLAPEDGAVVAMVGGFNFAKSNFNRIAQAERQPGSAFKPFIYSAALEHGFSAASIINDAPVVFEDPALESTWRPENYSGKFFGPTRLREALVESKNLVSIRLLQGIGIGPAMEHIRKFGLPVAKLPRNLSLALGSGALTPLELASGYAVFANGGFRVEPYVIARILNQGGEEIFAAKPLVVCRPCIDSPSTLQPTDDATAESPEQRVAPRVISAQNAYLMNSMMQDVIKRGTGRRARAMGRADIAGKTGTTNDQRDAWFAGYSPDLVAIVWIGYDQPQPLGESETGSRAALPMWIDYMSHALADIPPRVLERPDGLVTVRINAETGELARSGDADAIFEIFRADEVPRQEDAPRGPRSESTSPSAPSDSGAGITEQLF